MARLGRAIRIGAAVRRSDNDGPTRSGIYPTMPIIYYLCIAAAGRVGCARGAKWLIISYLLENVYLKNGIRFYINH